MSQLGLLCVCGGVRGVVREYRLCVGGGEGV